MSQSGVVAWSQTAASNSTSDSNVNWAEGMAPSAINNSARAQMSSVAKYRDDTAGSLTTGGTTTAYTLTTNQVFSSLTVLDGQELTVRFDQANGASPTLNVDTLGAKAIQIDASTAVPTGMIGADSIWRLTYDNSIPAFIINSVAKVLSLTTLTASGTVTGGDLAATDDLTVGDDATISGDLAVTGDFSVNTNKATIAGASGNTAFAGTLAVTGATTLTGALTANNSAGVTAYNASKAYATFTLSGTTVTSSSSKRFNISGVSRSIAGVFAVTFTNALPTANYIVVGSAGISDAGGTAGTIVASSRTTSGFTLKTYTNVNNNAVDPEVVDFVVLGF